MLTYPAGTESALIVTKKRLQGIIIIMPRFGLLLALGSDNSLTFRVKASQNLAELLNINWKLHCRITLYRPQSPVKIERINRTLQETLTNKIGPGSWRKRSYPSSCSALLRAYCTVYSLLKKKKAYYFWTFLFFLSLPCILPKVWDIPQAEMSNYSPLKSLKSLQEAHQVIQAVKGILPSFPSKPTHQGLWKYLMLSLEFITPKTVPAGLLSVWHTN